MTAIIARNTPRILVSLAIVMLTACEGGGGGGGPSSVTVGGTVSGLAGSGLVLTDNGSDQLAVSGNGSFVFTDRIRGGGTYSVSVLTQPTSPSQSCVVSNGNGTVGAREITSVVVACTTLGYTVGGSVSGLNGSGLVLVNNDGDALPVNSSGPFVFPTPVAIGSAYRVAVLTQPDNPVQNCVVMNESRTGVISSANVTTVAVVCANVGRFVYTSNGYLGSLVGFRIDPSTGAWAEIPGGALFGVWFGDVAVDPGSKFLYAMGRPGGVFAVNTTSGALSSVGSLPLFSRAGLGRPVFAPNGKSAYGVFVNPPSPGGTYPDKVYALSVNANSGAAALVGDPVGAGASVTSVAVDPLGRFAYATSPYPCVASPWCSFWGVGPAGLWTFALDPTTGALAAVAGTPFQGGSPFTSVAVEPSGRFVYLAGPNSVYAGAGVITALTVDATTGSFTPVKGSPYAADDPDPGPLVVEPSGTFVLVPNYSTNSISAYAIDASTGGLKQVAGSPFATDPAPRSLVVDPSGKFAYITHRPFDQAGQTGSITGWTIDGVTGVLAPLVNNPVATEVAREYVALHPSGKFAYVANYPSGISVYGIAGATDGALHALSSAVSGLIPRAVAVSPSGRFAYVANSESNDVSAYRIDALTGAAAPVATTPTPAGTSPWSIAVDPLETFVYVANLGSNDISAFTIDGETGALTPVSGSPFADGLQKDFVTIDPHGKFAYVVSGRASSPSISVYAIDRVSGALAPVPGSPFSISPSNSYDFPRSLAVDQSGQHLYVASSHGLLSFTVDTATGALGSMSPETGPYNLVSAVVGPSSKVVYAIKDLPGGVVAFSVDATTGEITSVGGVLPTGLVPRNVTIDSLGMRAYVACIDGVWVYSIDPVTGALTPMVNNPSAIGVSPSSIAIAN